jgi:hypothetical protein
MTLSTRNRNRRREVSLELQGLTILKYLQFLNCSQSHLASSVSLKFLNMSSSTAHSEIELSSTSQRPSAESRERTTVVEDDTTDILAASREADSAAPEGGYGWTVLFSCSVITVCQPLSQTSHLACASAACTSMLASCLDSKPVAAGGTSMLPS